ncbi:MAG: PspC domain-containing protein, partial [Chlorobi bacterium]|nr:PspC domain-containing protein [Chlorobiota bacterium]
MEMRERLYRSRTNRIFGGVAAGLGDYLNIDPIIVRVLFVGSIFLSGIGILLYIILWIVVPEENVFAS